VIQQKYLFLVFFSFFVTHTLYREMMFRFSLFSALRVTKIAEKNEGARARLSHLKNPSGLLDALQ